jgi:diguanylate cyclase (GGDEF)-like protein
MRSDLLSPFHRPFTSALSMLKQLRLKTVRHSDSLRFFRESILFLLLALITLGSAPLRAESLTLDMLPNHSLGQYSSYLIETDTPLSIEEIRTSRLSTQFRSSNKAVLNFGIGARPVWIRLAVINTSSIPQHFQLAAGTPWLDKLDVYIIHDGKLNTHWQTGDTKSKPEGLTPAVGFTFETHFAPGPSEIYLRAESIDPLVLPVSLTPYKQLAASEHRDHYGYGFFYGFLLALIAYNSMLFIGLRKRGYIYYSIYLINLLLLSLAYTGHGQAWLWAEHPLLQRYIILVFMVTFACCGLLFASRFLALAEHAPRALRLVQAYALTVITLLIISIVFDSQKHAVLVAFIFAGLFPLSMVLLGILTIRHGHVAGRYFLAAAVCGMLGASSTTLTVCGWIPYTSFSYHALEFGVAIEAILFALALAYQVRQHRHARLHAESIAGHDPLTGLYNRRAFFDLSQPIWSTAVRNKRPLSLIMLDLDHFKMINDLHGHDAGDSALTETANLLMQACRAGDIATRWGGEEFLLLLPETDLKQAYVLAERIRQSIDSLDIQACSGSIRLTGSFGVAERGQKSRLEELIKAADVQLYEAKLHGRNQTSSE